MRQRAQEELRHVAVYLPVSLYKEVDKRAKNERRSVSSTIVLLIEGALKG